jgi:phage terminase large subunit-like protein
MTRLGEVGQQIAEGLELAKRRRLPHQVIPPGGWFGWLLLAGRGAGKTDACARYVVDHVNGPPCLTGRQPHRIGIVGPTLGDAADACYFGESGILAYDPATRYVHGGAIGSTIYWPNQSVARLFGANTEEDVKHLRAGGNRCLYWFEELAAMRYMDAAFNQAILGLRSGPDPRWIASTSPKPRELIKAFAKGFVFRGAWTVPYAGRVVAVRHATTDDNPYLPAHIRAALVAKFSGTVLGGQEIEGRIVEQDPNALWTRASIAAGRISLDELPDLDRITVGVDPSGGAGEQGIVVVGKAKQLTPVAKGDPQLLDHGYVLGDYTCRLSPDGWGARAITAAMKWQAEDITAESDYGRDMPLSVLNGAAVAAGVIIPIRPVLAKAIGGKRVRAFPVAALARYQVNEVPHPRWHHVGHFPELEDQQCTWTEDAGFSPDRIDACSWAAWHIGLVSTRGRGKGSWPGREIAERVIG